MNLLVIDRKYNKVYKVKTFEDADILALGDKLGAECIEHCVEEWGRCDGTDFTIIPEEWVSKE